jgi:hypothetical protein
MSRRRQAGKKFPKLVAVVDKQWPEAGPLRALFQDEVRKKYFSSLVFNSLDSLEGHLKAALRSMEFDHSHTKSIVAWPWITNSLLI